MNNLKQFRSALGITQLDLAHRVGVSRTSIHNAECGRLSLELATRIGKAYKVNRYYLLGLDAIIGEPDRQELEIVAAMLEINL